MAKGAVIDVHAGLRKQVRQLKKGPQTRYTIDFSIQDLLVDTGSGPLAAEFGALFKDLVQKQWKSSKKLAKASTIQRRERARRNPNTRSYRKRYAGGRIGETPPTGSVRYAVDSARFVDNIVLRPRKRSDGESVITMNVPANRLRPEEFSSQAAFDEFYRKLTEIVPILGGKVTADQSTIIRQALDDFTKGMISNNEAKFRSLLAKRRKAILNIFKQAGTVL